MSYDSKLVAGISKYHMVALAKSNKKGTLSLSEAPALVRLCYTIPELPGVPRGLVMLNIFGQCEVNSTQTILVDRRDRVIKREDE